MKKLLSMFMALCLLVSCCAVATCEDDTIPFDISLTNAADRSAAEWCESNTSRSFLFGCILCDLILSHVLDDFEYDPSYDVYVGRTLTNIILCFCNDEAILCVFYEPLNDSAEYSIVRVPGLAETASKSAMEEFCYVYYTVSPIDQMDAISLIAEALND